MSRSDPIHRWLSDQVCTLRRETRRRRFATRLRIAGPRYAVDPPASAYDVSLARSDPGTKLPTVVLPAGTVVDRGLRVELLVRLLSDASPGAPQLVVIRSGPAELESSDLCWFAAWTHACGIRNVEVGRTWIVSRYGFADVHAGAWTLIEPRRHLR